MNDRSKAKLTALAMAENPKSEKNHL